MQHAMFWHRVDHAAGGCERKATPGSRTSALYEPARGRMSASEMQEMHRRLKRFFELDRLSFGHRHSRLRRDRLVRSASESLDP